MLAVLFAIGAFIEADFQTRSVSGNHDAPIFSYIRHDDNRAEFTAFGESIIINLEQVDAARATFGEINEANRAYAPSFIILTGEIIRACIGSVGGAFLRLPDIIAYFFNPAE